MQAQQQCCVAGCVSIDQDVAVFQVDFDDAKAGQWMLISRSPNGPRLEIDTPPQFIWHYASAEEHPETGAHNGDACHDRASSPLAMQCFEHALSAEV